MEYLVYLVCVTFVFVSYLNYVSDANYPLMLMIFEQINDYFDIIMLFLQNSIVTNRNSSINISIVQEDTLEAMLGTIQEQLPFSWII